MDWFFDQMNQKMNYGKKTLTYDQNFKEPNDRFYRQPSEERRFDQYKNYFENNSEKNEFSSITDLLNKDESQKVNPPTMNRHGSTVNDYADQRF